MRKVTVLLLSLVFLTTGFVGASFALPTDIILDNYLHPNDTNSTQLSVDVIGSSPPFDFFGYRWSGSELQIYTNWNHGLTGSYLGAYLGDIFFYSGDPSTTSGVTGALAVRDHDLSVEGDGIIAGDLFAPSSYRNSDLYFPGTSTGNFGDNEFVTGSLGQNSVLGNFSVYFSSYETGVNMISVDLGASSSFVDSMVRMQFTCANDVMASSAPVPEPATFILLGSGLAGLAFYRRKRK